MDVNRIRPVSLINNAMRECVCLCPAAGRTKQADGVEIGRAAGQSRVAEYQFRSISAAASCVTRLPLITRAVVLRRVTQAESEGATLNINPGRCY